MRAAILSLIVCLSWACSARSAAVPVDKGRIEQWARHLFVWGSQIGVTVSDARASELKGFREVVVTGRAGELSQSETLLISDDGRQIIRGTVYEMGAHPFAGDMKRLNTASAPMLGDPKAPVHVVVFSDFQCSFCRRFAKTQNEQLVRTLGKDVRVSFKDFPLDQIHPWARTASIAGRCIWHEKPEAFWPYHDMVFEQQAQLTPENLKPKVLEFARGRGLDSGRVEACMASKAAADEVQRSFEEGMALGINSTPTMFVNGRKLVGALPWDQLEMVVVAERDYARATQAAQ